MYTCTRRLAFDYGHRLMNHESMCKHVHGHRGVVEVTCAAQSLDEVGRVIDFADIKKIFGRWLDDNFDHSFLFNTKDKVMEYFLKTEQQRRYAFPGEPSAENICQHLAVVAKRLFVSRGIMVTHLKFYETENNWADWDIQDG